jgi:hypothetical protein
MSILGTDERSPATTGRDFQIGLLAFALVAGLQILIVRRFGVNVPFFDEWTLPPLLAAFDRGELGLEGLLAQHGEHRILFSRLAFLATYQIFGDWNVLTNMAASALVVGLIAGVWAYTLARLRSPLWAILLSCLAFISPLQAENQIWGFQLAFYLLLLGVMIAVCAVALRERVDWPLIVITAAACLLATFSIASGMASWPLIFACFVARPLLGGATPRALLRNRGLMLRLATFCLLALATAAVYFRGYTRPEFNDLYRTRNLETLLAWLFNTLTYPLTQNLGAWTLTLALGQWVVIVAGLMLYLHRRREPVYANRLLLFGGLLLFVIGNALLTGYSRGSTPTLASRYASLFLLPFAVFVPVAVDLLTALSRRTRPIALAPLLLLLLTLTGVTIEHARGVLTGLDLLQVGWSSRLEARRSLIAYLRETDPQALPQGILPLPSAEMLKLIVDNPNTNERLSASLRASSTLVEAMTTGNAWSPAAIPGGGGMDAPLGWSSWGGDATLTGRLETRPIQIEKDVLVVPIAGFPSRSGNRLILETTDEPHAWIAYQGLDSNQEWQDWRVDVSAFKGRSVRLVAVDGSTNWAGWLAVATPYQERATLALFDATLNQAVLIFCATVALLAPAMFLRRSLRQWLPAGGLLARTPTALTLLVAGAITVTAMAVFVVTSRPPPLHAADNVPRLRQDADLLGETPAFAPSRLMPKRTILGVESWEYSALNLGSFRVGDGMCLTAEATLDPRVPPDTTLDGVEAVVQIWQADQMREERSAQVLAEQPASLVLPLDPNVPLTVRLEMRSRDDVRYDWSIWRALRATACP